MNFPCSTPPQNCEGADAPLLGNASAETPDRIRTFGYKYFGDDSTFCLSDDPNAICNPPPPSNPPVTVIYSSNAQTCTIPCGDGTSQSYTALAGTWVSLLSQADADLQAFQFACSVATILCNGGIPVIYSNVAQTCEVPCAAGGTYSYTVDAGSFASLNSQQESNLLAFQFACAIAALLCPIPIPIPPGGGGGEPPPGPWYGNQPQTCTATCPQGGQFTYTVLAGLFVAESRAAANAIANSYACQRAAGNQVCLGAIPSECCINSSYNALIDSAMTGSVTWEVVAGALPAGLTLSSFGSITGTPVASGVFAFTIRESNTVGLSAIRTYSLSVVEITTMSLPDGDKDATYAQVLSATGAGASPTWSITDGALPDGLSLNPFSGVISGTPTLADDFFFTVGVQPEGGSIICETELSITINAVTAAGLTFYWDFESPIVSGLDFSFADQKAGLLLDAIEVNSTPPQGPNSPAGLIGLGNQTLGLTIAGAIQLAKTSVQLAYDPNTSAGFTAWCWFKIGDDAFLGGGSAPLLLGAISDTGFNGALSLGYNRNLATAYFEVIDASFTGRIVGAVFPNITNWHLFAGVYNNSTGLLELYIDGVLVNSDAGAPIITTPFVSGQIVYGLQNQNYGNVVFDEAGISMTTPYTAAQIAQIYNAGAGVTWPAVNSI